MATSRSRKTPIFVVGVGFLLSLVVHEYIGERLIGSVENGFESSQVRKVPPASVELRSQLPGGGQSEHQRAEMFDVTNTPSSNSSDANVHELEELDPSAWQRAKEVTKWHVERQFIVPVMDGQYHFKETKQAVTAEKHCSVAASQAKSLLAGLELKVPTHVRPLDGEILSYYRYFIFEGKYYFLRGNHYGTESGLRLDLLVSDSILPDKKKWRTVSLPVYRGEQLTDEKFYQVVQVLEDDYVSRGAVLASRSLVKKIKQRNAPDAEPAVLALYNGDVAALSIGKLNCDVVPSEQAPLHCSCPK